VVLWGLYNVSRKRVPHVEETDKKKGKPYKRKERAPKREPLRERR